MSQSLGLVPHVRQRVHELVTEPANGGYGDLELQHFEDDRLHLQHLSLGVGVVSDVHKLANIRGVDLLVLAGRVKFQFIQQLTFVSTYFPSKI